MKIMRRKKLGILFGVLVAIFSLTAPSLLPRLRKPLVSILMPVYNGEAYLERALDSALGQTLKRIEVICVDDGSTDRTARILADYAKKDRRIKLLRNERNRGTFYARVRAMAASRGRYVLWLDADDELFPDIGRRARAVAREKNADCVHFCTEYVRGNERTLAGKPLDPPRADMLEGDELLPALIEEDSVWYLWNKMYGGKIIRHAAERLMPYAEKKNICYVEDLPILWNAWRNSNKCVRIRDVGYRHYLGTGICARTNEDSSHRWHYVLNSAQAAAIISEQEQDTANREWAQKLRSVAARRFLRPITGLPLAGGVELFRTYLAKFPDDMQFEIFSAMLEQNPPWATAAANRMEFPRRAKRSEDGKISIALRIPTLAVGGVERVVSLLANHWAHDPRYRVTLVIDSDAPVTYPVDQNVQFLRVSPPASGHAYNADWYRLAQKIPMDVCICINYGNWFNYPLFKFLGVPILLQEHNFYYRSCFLSPGTILWRKLSYAGCAAVSCLSQVDLYQWRKDGVPRCLVLNNPLTFDPADIVPSDQSSKNVLWVGRWTEDAKRPHLAIEAFVKVLRRVPDAKLLMIGMAVGKDREYQERCIDRIKELGIQDSVEVLSFRDVAPYYRDGALLMMTSSIEGAPMVITEAKAHGLPVVLMRLGYLDSTRAGCLQTPKNDLDSLADAVANLLEDRNRRLALGREGRADIIENYSNEAAFRKYEDLIDAMIAGPAAVERMCAREPLPDPAEAENILAEEEASLLAVIRFLQESRGAQDGKAP
ncbi:MAG: glycosyltransferase [Puniceicoccales bacterium]|jgi:glycosyltransferase involved in cell wall biosynthesis|nr:glycosyltransferase [Puniceicoccales bacterium]